MNHDAVRNPSKLEKEFNEYCESNIHTSEYELRVKVMARWAQKEIFYLRAALAALRVTP